MKFTVSRADFTLEAAFQRPEFGLFRDATALVSHLFTALEPHGIALSDVKIERGDGTLAEFHLFCKLFDYGLTVRVRIDRVDIIGGHLTSEEMLKRFSTAVVDVLTAVQQTLQGGYRTYAVLVNVHGVLANDGVKSFLAQFVTRTPPLGPPTGNAVGYYYGPADDRLTSTVILDLSAVAPGGLYVRPQATWDATRLAAQDLPSRTAGFVRDVLESLGLQAAEPQ